MMEHVSHVSMVMRSLRVNVFSHHPNQVASSMMKMVIVLSVSISTIWMEENARKWMISVPNSTIKPNNARDVIQGIAYCMANAR